MKALEIRVKGIVQGVGFRPFIHRLAGDHSIKGTVINDTLGVLIHGEGDGDDLHEFVENITKKAPPLAFVRAVERTHVPVKNYDAFTIEKSREAEERLAFYSPDAALCDDCKRELFDESNRRYHYPFITCINCGPRFSIVTDVPYDRPNTEMKGFPQCKDCLDEYTDVSDRRFHSQPNACAQCGPRVELYDSSRNLLSTDTDAVIDSTVKYLRQGMVLAIKGIGGYHLAVDAANEEAVRLLRVRKKRPFKPFALMAKGIDEVKTFCHVSGEEEARLLSMERPVVLLRKRDDAYLSEAVAPGMDTLGFMLPYTPFQHLLFEKDPHLISVMTSANLSDEPIVYREEDAFARLGNIADFFVTYNREIAAQSDDSVIQVVDGEPLFIRRSRGYVPVPFTSSFTDKRILAMGGDMKNAFAMAVKDVVIMSQYLGDMADMMTHETFQKTVDHFIHVFDLKPDVIVSDMHPGYMTTMFANEMAGSSVERISVQHHHAHVVSVMEEYDLTGEVIGIAYDGTGYGTDGTLWGSEIMVASRRSFTPVARFAPFPLPGGESAIKDVWKIGHSLLYTFTGSVPETFSREETPLILQMMEQKINSPMSCSIGRLFDGISSLLNVSQTTTSDAQAAQLLEVAAARYTGSVTAEPLSFLEGEVALFDTGEMVNNILNLLHSKKENDYIARWFHQVLVKSAVAGAKRAREDTGITTALLSGGVFHNRILLSGIMQGLEDEGFTVYVNRKVPVNDGGIALGQLAIAKAMIE